MPGPRARPCWRRTSGPCAESASRQCRARAAATTRASSSHSAKSLAWAETLLWRWNVRSQTIALDGPTAPRAGNSTCPDPSRRVRNRPSRSRTAFSASGAGMIPIYSTATLSFFDRLADISTSIIRSCIFLAGNFRVVLAEPVFMLVRRPFAEGRTSKSVEGLASILASGSRLLTSCLNLFGSGFAGLGAGPEALLASAKHTPWWRAGYRAAIRHIEPVPKPRAIRTAHGLQKRPSTP